MKTIKVSASLLLSNALAIAAVVCVIILTSGDLNASIDILSSGDFNVYKIALMAVGYFTGILNALFAISKGWIG